VAWDSDALPLALDADRPLNTDGLALLHEASILELTPKQLRAEFTAKFNQYSNDAYNSSLSCASGGNHDTGDVGTFSFRCSCHGKRTEKQTHGVECQWTLKVRYVLKPLQLMDSKVGLAIDALWHASLSCGL
jgi:hypothetical protein